MIHDKNIVLQTDHVYEKALKFVNNKKEFNNKGLSNLYVIEKTDLDGNVIGEYFGMNLMTDLGMQQYFINNQSYPTNIYIGNGTGTFNTTTNVLLSPITTTASTSSSTTKSYTYPLYYYSLSGGLITCVAKYLVAYFDYNITGITDTITITEYGLGTTYNTLWTHSWVYDISGEKTYITKNVNERLTITVYMCMSYNETLITSGYANNRHTLITTMECFFNKMYETFAYTHKRNGIGVSRTKSNVSSAFMNNSITRYGNVSTFILEPGSSSSTGYFDGFCQFTNGYINYETQTLSTPESFDVITYPATQDDYGLSGALGHADFLPFTQANVSSVNLFNYDTGEYDNAESYLQTASRNYSETSMSTLFITPIYYTNNGTIITMYVYQNIHTTDDILSLNSNLTTVYATDKYWDVNSWAVVDNIVSIPLSLRNKRYWISSSNSISLDPIRASSKFNIVPTAGYDDVYSFTSENSDCYPTIDNYDYHWFMRGRKVYAVSTGITFDIGTTDSDISCFTYGKWLIRIISATTYSLVDMSDLSTTPAIQTITPLFSTATNLQHACWRTKTDTGIVCLQSTLTNESVVIDLRNGSHTQTLFTTKLATAIWGQNKMAYIVTTDTSKLRIYDFDSHTDVREVQLTGGITVNFMIAHRDYVWITDGSTYTSVIDINTGVVTACSYIIPLSTSADMHSIRTTAVDEVLVFYKSGGHSSSMANSYYVEYNNPTEPGNLSALEPSSGSSIVQHTLKKINNNTIALIATRTYYAIRWGSHNMVVDFGQFLKTRVNKSFIKVSNSVSNYIPYGSFINQMINYKTPLEYFLPHRVTGTTDTITSLNSLISVSGKQWSTVVSNITAFNGLPPGNQS